MARLSADEQAGLLALGVTRRLRPDTRVFVEGDRNTQVEVLRLGYVKVTAAMAGVPRLLAVRLPGDLIGEFASMSDSARTATVTTCGDVISTVIRQADFLGYLAARPRVAQQVTATVGERLRWANTRRAEFIAYPVTVRLARVLVDIAAACGAPGRGGTRIGVHLTQGELAALVGTAEDTIQRALRALRTSGLIDTGYRTITVLDPDGLGALAASADPS